MRSVEPIMDDIFHQHLLTHSAVQRLSGTEEGTSDDFYGGEKDNDYYDDLNDGPEGEDKHPDPFVQRMRDQEKNSAIDPQDIAQPNYYFVESVNGDTFTDTADLQRACSLADQLSQSQGI